MTTSNYTDVIVIGAGFAGLQCARQLFDAGRTVRVLEARDRVGGRTRSDQIGDLGVDVGGQWIGCGHERLRALAEKAGCNIRPQYTAGGKLLQMSWDSPGKMRRYDGLIPKISWLALLDLELAMRIVERKSSRIDPAAPWTAAQAIKWDGQTVATWADRQFFTRSGREVFDIIIRALLTSEPASVSLLYFLWYCASNGGFEKLVDTNDGAQSEIVEGGMPTVAKQLCAPFEQSVQLNEPVLGVEQFQDHVEVHTKNGRYQARFVVCAVPPALLGKIDWTPSLPVTRERAAAQSPPGSVIKAVIAYEKPFWREAGLSGEAISHRLPFNTVFDASWPEEHGGALVGFFDGQMALDYADASPDVRKKAVLDSLCEYFGPQARNISGYVDYNWLADPWAKGCYVGVMPPGLVTTAGPGIREPFGRVHWAGTETARRWMGYIEGALESGERAATEVHESLSKP